MLTKIVARNEPCKCGCKGQDPWHARFFRRKIRDIQVLDVVPDLTSMGGGKVWVKEYYREGVAHLPWGEERVVEVGVGLKGSHSRTKWWMLSPIR